MLVPLRSSVFQKDMIIHTLRYRFLKHSGKVSRMLRLDGQIIRDQSSFDRSLTQVITVWESFPILGELF